MEVSPNANLNFSSKYEKIGAKGVQIRTEMTKHVKVVKYWRQIDRYEETLHMIQTLFGQLFRKICGAHRLLQWFQHRHLWTNPTLACLFVKYGSKRDPVIGTSHLSNFLRFFQSQLGVLQLCILPFSPDGTAIF